MRFFAFGGSKINYRINENNIESKILGFMDFQNGWHYGEGFPPKFKTVARALKINDIAQLYDIDIDASLGVNGEIEVDCYNRNDTLEFTIEENEKITYVFERKGQEEEYKENLSIEDATNIFFEYIKKTCNLSELYTGTTTTGEKSDLKAWRLKIPPMEAAFRWFRCHA